MLRRLSRFAKRQALMLQFRGLDVRYHARRLGEAMAKPDDDFGRKYHREKIQESILNICDKKRIRRDDMRLIEEDLNTYINGLVSKSYEKESQRRQTREFVDCRIKIKTMGKQAQADELPPSQTS